jgi:hypothetical protein
MAEVDMEEMTILCHHKIVIVTITKAEDITCNTIRCRGDNEILGSSKEIPRQDKRDRTRERRETRQDKTRETGQERQDKREKREKTRQERQDTRHKTRRSRERTVSE